MLLAKPSLYVAVATLALTIAAASAQDAKKAVPKPAPRPATAQAPAPAPAPADAAAPAPAGPTVVKSETQAFDFWTVACDTLSEPVNARKCVARLPVVKSDTRQLVILLIAAPGEGADQQLIMQIPTAIMVQPGAALTLAGGEPRKFPILSCQPALCTGALPLDAALTKALSEAPTAALAWTAIGGAPIKVDFALKGAGPALQAAFPR
jgi:invasion protein IalB